MALMNDRNPKIYALRAISEAGGEPIPESTLRIAVRLAFPRMLPSDVDGILLSLRSSGYASTADDDLLGPVWLLTTKGKLRVAAFGDA